MKKIFIGILIFFCTLINISFGYTLKVNNFAMDAKPLRKVTVTASNAAEFKSWSYSGIELTEAEKINPKISFEMPYSDVTLIAIYNNSIIVTFNSNGGTGSMAAQTFTAGVAQNLTANTFTREDYTFKGWSTTANGAVEYNNGASYIANSNTTLYAVWQKNAPTTYTVTFNSNGGTGSMAAQTFTAGVAQNLAANAFTRQDYTFKGWSTTANGAVEYNNGASYTATKDATLYAVWQKNAPTTYTVTFNSNDGTGSMAAQTFTAGVAQNLTANAFSRSGNTFKGWSTTAGGTVAYANGASYTATQNATLYAVWACNTCTGTGYYCPGATKTKCTTCDGTGYRDCTTCGGDGRVKEECSSCDGSGGCPGSLSLDSTLEYSCDDCGADVSFKVYYCEACGTSKWSYKCGSCGNSDSNTRGDHSSLECDDCNGKGTQTVDCSRCGGDGERVCSNCDDGYVTANCAHGQSAPHYSGTTCSSCGGDGVK